MSRIERPTLVTAAIIKKGTQVLIAQRKADSAVEPNKWEFPGGKVEHGEHPEDGLRREIHEELGIWVKVRSFYDLVSHIYSRPLGKMHIVLLFYLCDFEGGDIQSLDVQDYRWVELGELQFFDFAEADVPVVDRLRQK